MVSTTRITRELVEHLAWLARIEAKEEELDAWARQLNRILEYFSLLDQADVEGVEPTYHVTELVNAFREDRPSPFPADRILETAPARKDRYIRAPRMV